MRDIIIISLHLFRLYPDDLLAKDQERLRKRIASLQTFIADHGIVLDAFTNSSASPAPAPATPVAPKGNSDLANDNEGLPERFMIEYAKTKRSTCRGCESPLGMGELRLGQPIKNFYSSQQGSWMWT